MALFVTFLLGIANFVLHKAVVESRHPLLDAVPGFFHLFGGRLGLLAEFALLLGALILVARGSVLWAGLYAGYSGVNALAAWLILSGKV
ncbi:MAG: hypothetical protein KGM49_02015 [Sphingomonadales bacterium]|nr:hypothetical protein [Sphingomonadales bacterium]